MTEFNWTPDELQAIIDEHILVLFMKGTPEAPQCGFSNRASQVLSQLSHPYASVNVLSDRTVSYTHLTLPTILLV